MDSPEHLKDFYKDKRLNDKYWEYIILNGKDRRYKMMSIEYLQNILKLRENP